MFRNYSLPLLVGIVLLFTVSHFNDKSSFFLFSKATAQNFKTYTNAQEKFSTTIPNNWLALENTNYSSNDTEIVTFNSPDKTIYVTASLDKWLDPDSDLKTTVNDYISDYKTGSDALHNFNLVNTTNSVNTQNKLQTTSITYTYDEDNQKYKDIETYFMHNNNLFTVSYEDSPDHFKNGLPVYNEIVSSFLVK